MNTETRNLTGIVESKGKDKQTVYRYFGLPILAMAALSPVVMLSSVPAVASVIMVSETVKNDFTGDGKSAILYLNSITGDTEYWKDAVKANAIYPGAYDTSYTYAGSGDFNGDGKADLLFYHASNYGTMIWDGAVKSTQHYPGVSVPGYSVAAICDVNGDGKDDVFWFNPTTGGTIIWSSANKTTVNYPGAQNTAYTVAACADFDGDGKADLFWHSDSTGGTQIWKSASKANITYPGILSDSSWSVIGAGDVNGDGMSDIIWFQAVNPLQPTTGSIGIWLGGQKSQAIYPGSNGNNMVPVAIGDYSGDQRADLIWVNTSTNGVEIWQGVNKGINVESYPGTYPSGFTMQK